MKHTIARKFVCPSCNQQRLIPPNSPVGKELLAKHNINAEEVRANRQSSFKLTPMALWFLAVVAFIFSLSLFVLSPFAGVLSLLAGLLVLPPVGKLLEKRFASFQKNPRAITATVLMSVATMGAIVMHTPQDNINDTPTTQMVAIDEMEVGEQGYLAMPGEAKSICLGTTKKDYDQVVEALVAQDYLGLLEIPGAFCVGQGTKVQLLEKGFVVRRVRIVGTHREVDADKFGLSGWTSSEWVRNGEPGE